MIELTEEESNKIDSIWYQKALPIVLSLANEYKNQSKDIYLLMRESKERIIISIYDKNIDWNELRRLRILYDYEFIMTLDPSIRILEKRNDDVSNML